MKTFTRTLVVVGTLIAAAAGAERRASAACSFPSWPPLPIKQRVADAETVCLAKWLSFQKDRPNARGLSTFEIVKVMKTKDANLKPGHKIQLRIAYEAVGTPGAFFLLLRLPKYQPHQKPEFTTVGISQAGYRYLVNAPNVKQKQAKRLGYYVRFLEAADEFSAVDAHRELERTDLKSLQTIAKTLPREKLRAWLTDPKTNPMRVRIYGILLGVRGEQRDAELLKKLVLAGNSAHDFRLGVDGYIIGYALLTGPKALDLIDRMFLSNKACSFAETYAAFQAVRYLWDNDRRRFGEDRLRRLLRPLLERPEFADIVLPELAKFGDWQVQDRVMRLLGDSRYDVASIKRAIIRFVLAAEADVAKGTPAAKLPPHVVKAKANLAILEKKEPKQFQFAKRFPLPPRK